MEQFFTECVGKYNEIVEAQKVASGAKQTSALEESAKKHLGTMFTPRKMPNFRHSKGFVTMTSVNQLLLCEEVRKDVFQALKLDNLPFPGVPEGLLFGSLSFSIHHPAFKVSNDACITLRCVSVHPSLFCVARRCLCRKTPTKT